MIRSKRRGVVGERRLVLRREVVRRAEALAVFLLAERAGEHGDLGAHRGGELDRHVAQAAHADDGHLLARAGAPAAQRAVRRDAGAQQRRRDIELDALGDAQGEALRDDDLLAVAAHRGLAVVARGVVGADGALGAVLLLAVLAELALAAGVDHAADADAVADLVLRDGGTHSRDDAGDLVPGHHREDGLAPLLAHLVDVAVADAGELDVDLHVVIAQGAALDQCGLERGSGGVGDQGGVVWLTGSPLSYDVWGDPWSKAPQALPIPPPGSQRPIVAAVEVTVLGTGAADGWPNAFCECASCAVARGTGEIRSQSSALVDDVLLLDCGPETLRQAVRAGRSLSRVGGSAGDPCPSGPLRPGGAALSRLGHGHTAGGRRPAVGARRLRALDRSRERPHHAHGGQGRAAAPGRRAPGHGAAGAARAARDGRAVRRRDAAAAACSTPRTPGRCGIGTWSRWAAGRATWCCWRRRSATGRCRQPTT